MMKTLTLCSLVAVVTTCLAYKGIELTTKTERSKLTGRHKNLRLTKRASGIRNGTTFDGFPETVEYDMDLEDHGIVKLELVLDRNMVLPKQSGSTATGKPRKDRTRPWKDDAIRFYTDKNGHGSFACTLTSDGSDVTCELAAIVNFGDESCYLSLNATLADCTPATNGTLSFRYAPDLVYNSTDRASTTAGQRHTRRKRSILPEPGHKTVEVAFFVDRAFMLLFYERFPGDTAEAEAQAELFVTLLANEMNVYYSTVKEVSNGELDIYVYPADIVFPDYGYDFIWSRNHNDGTYLYQSNNFDADLRSFVNSGFTEAQWDHAMGLTGLDLYSQDNSDLGYAYIGTVCEQTDYKYSINEYTNWDVARIAAHELGHALSADHDGQRNCPSQTYVMSANIFDPTSVTSQTYHYFSQCSVNAFMSHLSKYPDCTASNGFTDTQFQKSFCSGLLGQQDNSLDKQCQRATGLVESYACSAVSGHIGCYSNEQVSCANRRGKCKTYLKHVWNGTPCGTDKFCYKGRCVAEIEICGTTTTAPQVTCTCCDKKGKKLKRCCRRKKNNLGIICDCC